MADCDGPMRRKKQVRKNILVYKFWAAPVAQLPPELWDITHKMQRFWNLLVELRDTVSFTAETLPDQATIIYARFWDLMAGSSEESRRWRKNLKHASGLNWEMRDEVFERFLKSCRQAVKMHRAWPSVHTGLERVNIAHRFTEGGIEVAAIFRKRGSGGWRFGLDPVDPWAYEGKTRRHTNERLTRGFFGLSKGSFIEFKTVLHRSMHPGSIVKGVAWLGKKHRIKGWQWSISLTLEELPSIISRGPRKLVCGLDFGWRMLGYFIRVGMFCDSDGNAVEIRLPLDASTTQTRRHNIASGWRDLIQLDESIGNLLQQTKTDLIPLLPSDLPENLGDLASHIPTLRQSGLLRLLRGLITHSLAPEAQDLLRGWLAENDRLRSLRSALQDRLVGRRRWLYRNVAAYMARRYACIAIADDFSIKETIENPAFGKFGIILGRRYQRWSAVGELREYLVEATSKHGSQILKASTGAGWGLVKCHVCSDEVRNSASLELVCSNGHRWDVDLNSALNLLRATDPAGPLETADNGTETLAIPGILRGILVPKSFALAGVA
jgi:hypothetical protein